MKKKLFAAVLAVCLLVTMAVPAFATGETGSTSTGKTLNSSNKTGTTELKYTTTESYTVTIPADITFTTNEKTKSGQEVSATNVIIAQGNELTVTVSSGNGYVLKSDTAGNTEELSYKLEYGEDPSKVILNEEISKNTETTILTVGAGTTSGSVSLTATLLDDAKKADTYKDTLTFKVSVGASKNSGTEDAG